MERVFVVKTCVKSVIVGSHSRAGFASGCLRYILLVFVGL